MRRSDGIALLDRQVDRQRPRVNQRNCPVYDGAYIRWCVVRRNHMSGISLAQLPARRCASVTNNNPNSTDLVSEHNVIECPSGGTTVNANGVWINWTDIRCHHCVTRP